MGITGSHMLFYSPEADALREALKDVFEWDHVDAGGGWLIFKMPPAEIGVHPGDAPGHAISLMCDDLEATIEELTAKGIEFTGHIEQAGFGRTTEMVLPGRVHVMLYQPRHPTAI